MNMKTLVIRNESIAASASPSQVRACPVKRGLIMYETIPSPTPIANSASINSELLLHNRAFLSRLMKTA